MSTLLTIGSSVNKRLNLGALTTVKTNTDPTVVLLLELLEAAGRSIRSSYAWPETRRTHLITLVSGQENYDLPDDFDNIVFETLWDRNNYWPLIGPLSLQEWQFQKSGLATVNVYSQFVVRGMPSYGKEFYVNPIPDSDSAGNIFAFNYNTKTWITPNGTTAWATATVYAANAYVYYKDNLYKTAAGGTSGATPPTHTVGSASDGAVTWTIQTIEAFTHDSDVVHLDSEVLIEQTKWRMEKELKYGDWQTTKLFSDNLLEEKIAGKKGARDICFGRRFSGYDFYNVPETGYGS